MKSPKYTVGVDLRGLEPGFKAHFGRGTGRYAANLQAEFGQTLTPDIVIKGLGMGDLSGTGLQRKILECAPCGRETLRTQLFLPSAMRRARVDLVHFLAHGDAPARSSVPYAVTVLDLIPLRFPELYKPLKADWRFNLARKLELRAIEGARVIFAISQATKRDLVELLHVDESRILVTPLAASKVLREPEVDELRLVCEKLKLENETTRFLYVGGIDARKNISFLLQVFKGVVQRACENGENRPCLILVGAYASDARYRAVLEEISRFNLADRVKLAGYVTDSELAALYRLCTLNIFPSLYEGFGLPVLEAMQAGLPVVCGNNSSIPEVAGEAAVLLPDNDTETWVNELLCLIQSSARRADLRERGIRQAGKFSWKRTAELTLEGYRQALGGRA